MTPKLYTYFMFIIQVLRSIRSGDMLTPIVSEFFQSDNAPKSGRFVCSPHFVP